MGDARVGVLSRKSAAKASCYVITGLDLVAAGYVVQWDGCFGETLPLDRRLGFMRFFAGLQIDYQSIGASATLVAPSIPWDDPYGRDWDRFVSLSAWYRF